MTARYGVTILPSALGELARLPQRERRRIIGKIDRLAIDPRPHGVTKLKGHQDHYRIRAGDYRIAYAINDGARTVMVDRIGHRRDVYRGL